MKNKNFILINIIFKVGLPIENFYIYFTFKKIIIITF